MGYSEGFGNYDGDSPTGGASMGGGDGPRGGYTPSYLGGPGGWGNYGLGVTGMEQFGTENPTTNFLANYGLGTQESELGRLVKDMYGYEVNNLTLEDLGVSLAGTVPLIGTALRKLGALPKNTATTNAMNFMKAIGKIGGVGPLQNVASVGPFSFAPGGALIGAALNLSDKQLDDVKQTLTQDLGWSDKMWGAAMDAWNEATTNDWFSDPSMDPTQRNIQGGSDPKMMAAANKLQRAFAEEHSMNPYGVDPLQFVLKTPTGITPNYNAYANALRDMGVNDIPDQGMFYVMFDQAARNKKATAAGPGDSLEIETQDPAPDGSEQPDEEDPPLDEEEPPPDEAVDSGTNSRYKDFLADLLGNQPQISPFEPRAITPPTGNMEGFNNTFSAAQGALKQGFKTPLGGNDMTAEQLQEFLKTALGKLAQPPNPPSIGIDIPNSIYQDQATTSPDQAELAKLMRSLTDRFGSQAAAPNQPQGSPMQPAPQFNSQGPQQSLADIAGEYSQSLAPYTDAMQQAGSRYAATSDDLYGRQQGLADKFLSESDAVKAAYDKNMAGAPSYNINLGGIGAITTPSKKWGDYYAQQAGTGQGLLSSSQAMQSDIYKALEGNNLSRFGVDAQTAAPLAMPTTMGHDLNVQNNAGQWDLARQGNQGNIDLSKIDRSGQWDMDRLMNSISGNLAADLAKQDNTGRWDLVRGDQDYNNKMGYITRGGEIDMAALNQKLAAQLETDLQKIKLGGDMDTDKLKTMKVLQSDPSILESLLPAIAYAANNGGGDALTKVLKSAGSGVISIVKDLFGGGDGTSWIDTIASIFGGGDDSGGWDEILDGLIDGGDINTDISNIISTLI